MAPAASRLIAIAVAVTSLALSATTVSSASDLGTCSLVAVDTPSPDPLGTILEAVTFDDEGDAWAVGAHVVGPISKPYVQRWNGASWAHQRLDLPEGAIGLSSLYDVKAFAPDDVWAVGSWRGDEPLIQRWNGERWSAVAAPRLGGTERILTGVDGTSSDDVWIVGQRRFDGQQHAIVLQGGVNGLDVVAPPDASVLHDVEIRGDGSPLVAGWRINDVGFADAVIAGRAGEAWIAQPTPEKEDENVFILSLASHGASTYAVGFANTSPNADLPITYRSGPDGWTELPEPDLGPSTRLVSVASNDAGTVAVGSVAEAGASRAVAIRWTGRAWKPVPGAGAEPPDTLAGVALDGGDVWAVGRAVVVGATYGVPSARVYSCG